MCHFFEKKTLSRKTSEDVSLCLIGPSWSILRPIPDKREQVYCGWLGPDLPPLLGLAPLLPEQNHDSVGKKKKGGGSSY